MQNNNSKLIDTRRVIRYISMFVLVLTVTFGLTHNKLEQYEWILLALAIMICFLFIDLYYPIVVY